MKTHWNEVRLGEVLNRYLEEVIIDDFQKYKRITIRIKGGGIELRDEALGGEIGTKRQFRVYKDQFLMSKIDAMNGAFGIIPNSCNEAIITGNFWSYTYNKSLVSKDFLGYLCLKGIFTSSSLKASSGTTNRKYLDETKFLNLTIPLPPLNEQQRIVATLDAVKTGLNQVEQLRARQNHDVKALLNKLFEKLFNEAILVTVGEVLIGKRNSVSIEPTQTYQQITVRMDHKGVVLRQLIKGSEVGSAQLLANENDFIISKIDARNGAMGLVPADLDGGIVTNDFPLYSFSERIRPDFFSFVVNTRYFDEACKNASEGTTNRKRLKTSKFESILIPLPTLIEQDSLLQLLNSLGQLQAQQVAGAGLLAQLMPSLLAQAFET